MLDAFLSYIKKEELPVASAKTILAVSGGVDSVVMCELFHLSEFPFAIVHCNFQLRGKESDEDELFVKGLSEKYKVPFFCKRFNTASFAEKQKISVQMAARELRYKWFEELRKKEQYHRIATAHHRDDSIETFFINLIRGTGISGLHGILPKQGKLIRPLLFAGKEEIRTFAKKNKIKFREDSSNRSEKYMRNTLRLKVIPVLKELNPDVENTFLKNIHRLREAEAIYKNEIEKKRSEIVKQEKEGTRIAIGQLKKLSPLSAYLFEFLSPYHFNADTVSNILHALESEPGKQFYSDTHRLIKDREFLIIQKLKAESQKRFQINKAQKELIIDGCKLNFKIIPKSHPDGYRDSNLPDPQAGLKSQISANLDLEKLTFPLEVRKWQKGDSFYPLGMKGKKKLSDFFIDRKLSLDQKENTWLLTSAGKIAWVIGMRMDDRFKITDKTKKIYFAELV